MLMNCPECELQVSDKALSCPHCGYPINAIGKTKKNSKRKRRLPNGFGRITEIKNKKLRKRFRVMATVGKNPDGSYIAKLLKPESYFATYNEAYAALLEYNKNPYDLDSDLTVKELYEKWSEKYFESLKSDSSKRTITSAWAYCSSVYEMRVQDVRARHIKGCIENSTVSVKNVKKYPSAGMKSRIKSLFNLMLDYALEYELVDKNYARTFSLSDEIIDEQKQSSRGHLPFSDEEMEKLWENITEIKYVDVLLIQCYSGWRPQELGLIRLENVDLEKGIFIGGIKTTAGTNRTVPIHSRILPIVEKKYNEALTLKSEYLINCTDSTTHRGSLLLTYDKYQHRFKKIRDSLKLNPLHRAHDGRMHFITMAKKYNVNEYAIKYMVGHEIRDITEKVYTKRDTEWLKQEIEKIK